jgi:hypothetical protein
MYQRKPNDTRALHAETFSLIGLADKSTHPFSDALYLKNSFFLRRGEVFKQYRKLITSQPCCMETLVFEAFETTGNCREKHIASIMSQRPVVQAGA